MPFHTVPPLAAGGHVPRSPDTFGCSPCLDPGSVFVVYKFIFLVLFASDDRQAKGQRRYIHTCADADDADTGLCHRQRPANPNSLTM